MKNTARLFSVLSEPARLEILRLLGRKEGCVSAIQLETGRNQPNISQHLRVLKDAGLVSLRRDGKKICYFLADKNVKGLLSAAEKVGVRI
jgi:ArsR family transcriptional regulator